MRWSWDFIKTYISNLYLINIPWSFPRSLQKAYLQKRKKKTVPFNYRPSSMWIISKVIERIIYEQTNKFFKENNILYNFQSGFRFNKSVFGTFNRQDIKRIWWRLANWNNTCWSSKSNWQKITKFFYKNSKQSHSQNKVFSDLI